MYIESAKGKFRRNKKLFVHRLTLAASRANGFKISTLLKTHSQTTCPSAVAGRLCSGERGLKASCIPTSPTVRDVVRT